MLLASFVVALLVDFGLPIALGVYLRRRFGVSWRIFLYGAIIFAGFQLVTRVPAVTLLNSLLRPSEQSAAFQWTWLAALALTAGIFEEVGRYVGYRWLFRGERRTWDRALMFGAGHGGLEAMGLVGLQVLSTLVTVIAFSRLDAAQWNLPEAQATQVRQLLALPWWMPLLGAFERIGAMAVHVSLAVMVLQVFTRGRLIWLWIAVGYHATMNFAVVGLAMRFWGPIGAELAMALFALISLGVIFALRPGAWGKARFT